MDRQVLGSLSKARGCTVLPQKPKPCTAARGGDRKARTDAIRLLGQGVPSVVLCLDLDSRTPEDLFASVEAELHQHNLAFVGSAGRYGAAGTEFVVVLVGLPGDPKLSEFGVRSHAMDDFLVRMLLDPATYDGVVKSNKGPAPPHGAAVDFVKGVLGLAGRQGIPFDSSKHVLALFRLVIQFGASLARFAESILKHAPEDLRRSVLQPLEDALP